MIFDRFKVDSGGEVWMLRDGVGGGFWDIFEFCYLK